MSGLLLLAFEFDLSLCFLSYGVLLDSRKGHDKVPRSFCVRSNLFPFSLHSVLCGIMNHVCVLDTCIHLDYNPQQSFALLLTDTIRKQALWLKQLMDSMAFWACLAPLHVYTFILLYIGLPKINCGYSIHHYYFE